MQQVITNLENHVETLMEQYRYADGYLKEIIGNSIKDKYFDLCCYHRNLPDNYHMPKYNKIASFVQDKLSE